MGRNRRGAWLAAMLMGMAAVPLPALSGVEAQVFEVQAAPVAADASGNGAGEQMTVALERSRIQIGLDLGFAALTQALNQQLPPEFSGEVDDPTDLLSKDTLVWSVKRGAVVLKSSADGRMVFSASLREGHARVKGKAVGIKSSFSAEFSGTVHGSVKPRLRPDWSVDLDLTADIDLDQAEKKLFGKKELTVSFRGLIRDKADQAVQGLARKLNEKLRRDNRLREQMQELWASSHSVIPMSEDPPAWLLLRPVSAGINAPRTAGGSVQLEAQVALDSALHIGSEPPPPPPTALPAPATVTAGNGFVATVAVGVALKAFRPVPLERLGLPSVLEIPGGRAEFGDLRLSGRADVLTVCSDLSVTVADAEPVRTNLCLSGTPLLDRTQGQLRVAGLRHEFADGGMPAALAQVLLEPLIARQVEQRSVFELAELDALLAERAQRELDKLAARLPAALRLDVDIARARIVRLVLSDDQLLLVLQAAGSAVLHVAQIDRLL